MMKNGKTLHRAIGYGVVLLAVFAFAGPSYSRSSCNTCRTCPQSQQPNAPVEYAELQYRDGYPGPRLYKRQQVRKLQCMLSALGYCSGSIDGWYGKSTAQGVMLFLADTFQDIGNGHRITAEQWDHLENWVGSRCTKYNPKKRPSQYDYRTPQYQPQYQQQFYEYKY
ncbi:MAG: hypothetical protein D3916_01860 [Candidatus Electrothrix sp. MAN1_4]|nr:hypothetical protein [Candidatus Electrothrix sp. MAN1_4]